MLLWVRVGVCFLLALVGTFLGCFSGCKLGCGTGREVGVEAGDSREPREGGTGNGKRDKHEIEGYSGWKWGEEGGGGNG